VKKFEMEAILAHAEIAASYLRTLLENGVAMASAVSMTSSYISSLQFIEWGSTAPKEPWTEEQ
jgi:hypothetical protein